MIKWLAGGAAALMLWMLMSKGGPDPTPDRLSVVSYRNGGQIQTSTSDKVPALKYLHNEATNGAYSVVNISSESCPYCKQLEPRLVRFAGARPDVQIKTINLPSPPPECLGGMDGEQFAKCEPHYAAVKKEYKRLGVCHTPHIAIYDPSGRPLAEDSCNGRKAQKLLYEWLRHEGVS